MSTRAIVFNFLVHIGELDGAMFSPQDLHILMLAIDYAIDLAKSATIDFDRAKQTLQDILSADFIDEAFAVVGALPPLPHDDNELMSLVQHELVHFCCRFYLVDRIASYKDDGIEQAIHAFVSSFSPFNRKRKAQEDGEALEHYIRAKTQRDSDEEEEAEDDSAYSPTEPY